jgi:hypothetical protein
LVAEEEFHRVAEAHYSWAQLSLEAWYNSASVFFGLMDEKMWQVTVVQELGMQGQQPAVG